MEKVRTLKIGIIGIAIALVLILFSFAKISSINQSMEVNGLGDAMVLTCGQTEALGSVLGFSPEEDCKDDPEQLGRASEYGKKPLYTGIGIVGGILILLSGGLIFYSKRKPVIKNLIDSTKNSHETEEGSSLEEKLLQLLELKKKGLITEEEYVEKRSKFLHGL
jgi:hypothetical protein